MGGKQRETFLFRCFVVMVGGGADQNTNIDLKKRKIIQ